MAAVPDSYAEYESSLVPTQPDLTELQRQYSDEEASIQRCMGAAGFEYVLEDFPDETREALEAEGRRAQQGSRVYIASLGLGISTLRYNRDWLSDDLIGYEEQDWVESFTSFEVSPNTGIYSGLSDLEQQAYDEALFGADDSGGCIAAAVAQSRADEGVIQELVLERDELIQRALADDRVVLEETELRDCLTAAGFRLDFVPSEVRIVDGLIGEIEVRLSLLGDPFDSIPDIPITGDLEADDAAYAEAVSNAQLSEPDLAELREIQDFELMISRQIAKCNPGYLAVSEEQSAFYAVLADLERSFLGTS